MRGVQQFNNFKTAYSGISIVHYFESKRVAQCLKLRPEEPVPAVVSGEARFQDVSYSAMSLTYAQAVSDIRMRWPEY